MREATPRATLLAKRLLETPTTARTGGTTYENRAHLAAEFMSQITLTGCGAAGQGGARGGGGAGEAAEGGRGLGGSAGDDWVAGCAGDACAADLRAWAAALGGVVALEVRTWDDLRPTHPIVENSVRF